MSCIDATFFLRLQAGWLIGSGIAGFYYVYRTLPFAFSASNVIFGTLFAFAFLSGVAVLVGKWYVQVAFIPLAAGMSYLAIKFRESRVVDGLRELASVASDVARVSVA